MSVHIQSKDEDLLRHLIDIEYVKPESTNDFVLKFHFSANPYMQNTVITKRYVMGDPDTCTKIECTKVRWKANMNLLEVDPTKNSTGKGKKKKKKEQSTESFFWFFTEKQEVKGDPNEDDLDDEDEERLDAIEDDYTQAVDFRDELIPLALEYYLNIVEEENEGDEEDIADNVDKPDGEEVNDEKSDKSLDD